MKTKITEYNTILEPMIKNIIMELKTKPSLDISLLGGDFGAVLSLYYASKHQLCSLDQADELLDKTFRSLRINSNFPVTYCDGLVGLCIGLWQLEKDGYIDGAKEASLTYFEYILSSLKKNLPNNLDFLHGAIGISMYFMLFENHDQSIEIIESVISHLYNSSFQHSSGGIYWKFPNRYAQNIENLSLSHGISAVVQFLARAHNMNIKESIKVHCEELIKNW